MTKTIEEINGRIKQGNPIASHNREGIKRQSLLNIRLTAGQIFALALIGFWGFVVISKGITDILWVSENNPGDFLRNYFIYLMHTIGG